MTDIGITLICMRLVCKFICIGILILVSLWLSIHSLGAKTKIESSTVYMISGWTIIMQSAAICQRTCNVFPPVRSRPLASVSNEITFACIFLHGISHDNTSGNFALPSIYQIVGGPCYLLSATYRLTSRTAPSKSLASITVITRQSDSAAAADH